MIDFKPIGVEQSIVEATTNLLRGDLSSYKKFTLVEKDEMERLAGGKVECEDKEAAAEIGFKVKAQKVVYGTISKLGTKYIISANVVEVSSHGVIYRREMGGGCGGGGCGGGGLGFRGGGCL